MFLVLVAFVLAADVVVIVPVNADVVVIIDNYDNDENDDHCNFYDYGNRYVVLIESSLHLCVKIRFPLLTVQSCFFPWLRCYRKRTSHLYSNCTCSVRVTNTFLLPV